MNIKTKISIVGSGNLATHLAVVFFKKGFVMEAVFSRDVTKAKKLADAVGAQAVNTLEKLPADSDFYFLAVNDDAIENIAEAMPVVNGTVLHCSGSSAMSILQKKKKYGVFYPLQTFTKNTPVYWGEIPICIEGDSRTTLDRLSDLSHAIGASCFKMNSDKRLHLHLAAVWVNNFTNHLLYEAEEICKEASLPFELLQPLAQETIRKIFQNTAAKSLTGPARRGDEKVLRQHINLMGAENETRMMLYLLLSKAIHRRAADEK